MLQTKLRATRQHFAIHGCYHFTCEVSVLELAQLVRDYFGGPVPIGVELPYENFFSVNKASHSSNRDVQTQGVDESNANTDAHIHETTPLKQIVLNSIGSCVQSFFDKAATIVAVAVTISALTLGLAVFLPDIYYLVVEADTIAIPGQYEFSVDGTAYAQGAAATRTNLPKEELDQKNQVYQPPKNEYLPEGEWLNIPRIGVYTELHVTKDPSEALKEGVWRDPEFGEAGDLSSPVILAAHRYGYQWWWEDDYWEYHSFYNLPEIEVGDRIELIRDQRRYVYEIYRAEEGEEITDYEADLILYTCKFLRSPLRHIRYARVVQSGT